MATANPLQESPNPVPSGQVGTITVTFQTGPGTPDVTANIQLTKDGVVTQSATGILLKGTSVEATPSVTIGTTGIGWEIQTTSGTLASLGANQFSIRY